MLGLSDRVGRVSIIVTRDLAKARASPSRRRRSAATPRILCRIAQRSGASRVRSARGVWGNAFALRIASIVVIDRANTLAVGDRCADGVGEVHEERLVVLDLRVAPHLHGDRARELP